MQRFSKTLLAAALMLTGTAALAVAPAPSGVPNQTVTSAAVTEVNPFVGSALSVEHAQQRLELAKLQTQLKQEEVAYKNAETDLTQLPKKRAADLKKTLAVSNGGMGGFPSMPAISLASEKKKPAPKAEPQPAAKYEAPAPRVEVLSVMGAGGERQALLSLSGNVVSVKTGETTQMGRVIVLNDTQVSVGGATYTMHTSNLARQTVPVQPVSTAGGARSPFGAAMVNPGTAVAGFPGQSRASGTRTAIMPPGLSAD